eukprot:GHVU01072383.1.p1 GENE.GHVU01072383.1~~GHVU01072383.1.p1  ORF type:complete len:396 (-),score=90.64 GHVU01072383.1:158-1345(-)
MGGELKIEEVQAYKDLLGLVDAAKATHLRDLVKSEQRAETMCISIPGLTLDYSRQKVTPAVLEKLQQLAREMGVPAKTRELFAGAKVNTTEGRPALHTALRLPRGAPPLVPEGGSADVVAEVHKVLDSVFKFAADIREGRATGHTGKPLHALVCVGIGGSYLGTEYLAEALKVEPAAAKAATGRTIRFLANIDPVDAGRATMGLDPETTLVVVISKTFTTAETMANAHTMRRWIVDALGEAAVGKHMAAVSTNLELTAKFGIDDSRVFAFWDWVGGRFSLSSAVGMLPVALQYGEAVARSFLDGCHVMDRHFREAPPEKNIPLAMALLGVWNCTFLGLHALAVLPYSQALTRFAAHIQQLAMESNGKRVTKLGAALPVCAGEIVFGEPGTNGQHR